MSTHYDLLIQKEDDFALNRSRQLKLILSCCSSQSQTLTSINQGLIGNSQRRLEDESYLSQEDEEVDYAFSSSAELYHHEGSQDWDWSQDCFVHD